jgi:small subunit ribosomal protein S6e
MPEFQLNLSDPKTRRAVKLKIEDPKSSALLNLRIGDVIDGGLIGIKGKIKITGGSDRAGIPMRPDVHGPGKKYVLLSDGPGFRPRKEGERRRKLVRGNVISEEIYQINAVLVEGELPKVEEAAQ